MDPSPIGWISKSARFNVRQLFAVQFQNMPGRNTGRAVIKSGHGETQQEQRAVSYLMPSFFPRLVPRMTRKDACILNQLATMLIHGPEMTAGFVVSTQSNINAY
jgi:hypothetical protein